MNKFDMSVPPIRQRFYAATLVMQARDSLMRYSFEDGI